MSLHGVTICFRVDASLELGMGHVARCSTLASALQQAGARCHFLTRPAGALTEASLGGHVVHALTADPAREAEDALAACAVLERLSPSLVIVDHYSLGLRWESRVRPLTRHILALDDLANRPHDCDVLLDPNLGRTRRDYAAWVPAHCEVLAGPEFAPLRAEFRSWREYSLRRRSPDRQRHLFVSMGGVDAGNATSAVLQALERDSLPPNGEITVVLGARAPWIGAVRDRARLLPWETQIVVDPPSMAALMAENDLAVGGAGSTAWERCCLGLPTLALALAENQRPGLSALMRAHAVIDLGAQNELSSTLPAALREIDGQRLGAMSAAAARLVDGRGSERIVSHIEQLLNHE